MMFGEQKEIYWLGGKYWELGGAELPCDDGGIPAGPCWDFWKLWGKLVNYISVTYTVVGLHFEER